MCSKILHSSVSLPSSVRDRMRVYYSLIEVSLCGLSARLRYYKQCSNEERRSQNELIVEDRDTIRYISDRTSRGEQSYMTPPLGRCSSDIVAFRREEAQRARQRFLVAPDRDLVYVTDPRHPRLFLQLLKSPWCKEVQYLALLVYDCRTETNWQGVDIGGMAGALWQPSEPGPFAGMKVKEIALVAKPETGLSNYYNSVHLPMCPRHDIYGFMDYEALRNHGSFDDLFTTMNRYVVDETYSVYTYIYTYVYYTQQIRPKGV
ncbi:hypothetical protein F5Y09DRAFT_306923 [Xylaria sp. FL1042]|nr:hypothetical protein F5Y09DRAFT_306923 [Xylaria sp. FL1042]